MAPHPIITGKSARETIAEATRQRHPGAERDSIDIDFEDDRAERLALKPWWRRAAAWITDLNKGVGAIAGIAAATIAAHAWIHGLVSKRELQDAVKSAVTDAMVATNARLTTVETNTAGIPAWRGATQDAVVAHGVTLTALTQRTEKLEDRLFNGLRTR